MPDEPAGAPPAGRDVEEWIIQACPARTGRAAHHLWTMHLDHRLAIALAIGILVVTISAAILSAMM